MQDAQALRQAVDELELSDVARLYAKRSGYEMSIITCHVSRYRDFLYVAGVTRGSRLVPSEAIDGVWHEHIDLGEIYGQDMRSIYGCFFEHDPSFYGTQAWHDAWKATRRSFMELCGYDPGEGTDWSGEINPSFCGGMVENKPTICESRMISSNPAYCGGMHANQAAWCGGGM